MKNWKTTLFGILMAMAVMVEPLINSESWDWKKIIFAMFIALFGYFAKDKDVTGV